MPDSHISLMDKNGMNSSGGEDLTQTTVHTTRVFRGTHMLSSRAGQATVPEDSISTGGKS